MPAVDSCEPQVINALQKAGWSVRKAPFFFQADAMTFFIDLEARRGSNGHLDQILIVEVKCFSDARTSQDELYRAIGQYIVYRAGLNQVNAPGSLYLAVPADAFESFLNKQVLSAAFRESQIKFLVVDLVREEIVAWIN